MLFLVILFNGVAVVDQDREFVAVLPPVAAGLLAPCPIWTTSRHCQLLWVRRVASPPESSWF